MSEKFLKRDDTTGLISEKEATEVSTGATNAGDIPALDSTGRLSLTVMPVGVGPDTKSIVASENLLKGDLVYIFDNAGTPTIGKAVASVGGYPVVGFVDQAYTTGQACLVYFEGVITGLTGLSIGSRYYLSDVNSGKVTATPVQGAGKLHQFIGKAISATELSFEADDVIVLA